MAKSTVYCQICGNILNKSTAIVMEMVQFNDKGHICRTRSNGPTGRIIFCPACFVDQAGKQYFDQMNSEDLYYGRNYDLDELGYIANHRVCPRCNEYLAYDSKWEAFQCPSCGQAVTKTVLEHAKYHTTQNCRGCGVPISYNIKSFPYCPRCDPYRINPIIFPTSNSQCPTKTVGETLAEMERLKEILMPDFVDTKKEKK